MLEVDKERDRMGDGSLDDKRLAIDGFAWELSKEIHVSHTGVNEMGRQ